MAMAWCESIVTDPHKIPLKGENVNVPKCSPYMSKCIKGITYGLMSRGLQ